MKKRPILFSAEMVRAILDGRKTQTRRIIKPQPKLITSSGRWYWEKALDVKGDPLVDASRYWWEYYGTSPYGKFGDQLWVRETWNTIGGNQAIYKSDFTISDDRGPWKPPIFMPRWASRIQLEITDVRVERIQDISEDDVQAEGICTSVTRQNSYPIGTEHRPNAQEYAIGWDKINGKGSWESNPWVWVIEFRKIKRRKQ